MPTQNKVNNSDNNKRNENDRENLSITDEDEIKTEAITKNNKKTLHLNKKENNQLKSP